MTETFYKATEIEVGFHPDGFRIDKTAFPLNRYTKWEVLHGNKWTDPAPVCFDTLPQKGWIKKGQVRLKHRFDGGCLVKESSASRFDFGGIAHRYNAWYRTPRGAMYDRLEKEAIDKLLPPATKGGKLMEVGSGTGHCSEYFSNKGFKVTGVDISKQMIAISRQKNIAGGTFKVADAERLPFADGTFDVSAAITTLEFVADPAGVVAEMVRCVKKPGGMLIVGALNRLSAYNQGKKRRANSMYASANLISPEDMRNLLSPFGEPAIHVAGYVPLWDSLLWLFPCLERMGGLTGNKHGTFLAAKVAL